MKFLLFLGAIHFVFAHPPGKIRKEANIQDVGISPKLTFAATADGKSFFVELFVHTYWRNASATCTELGLSLASITTAAQFDALNTANITGFPTTMYWTAGRDAQEIRQFSWNKTGEPLSESFLPFRKDFEYGGNYGSCVYFSKGISTSYLSHWPCENGLYPMCETN